MKNMKKILLVPMFNEKYPNIKVTPTYASSGDLQTQIENGLEADIFMSASNKQMNALADEDLIDNSTNVQTLENKVVLIVPKDSDSNITSFAGQYAKEVLTNLGIWDSVESKLSLGTDVTAVLNQVAQGSADCGIVYATDAKSNEDVKVICEAPEDALDTPVIYPVAVVKDSKNADAANKNSWTSYKPKKLKTYLKNMVSPFMKNNSGFIQ